MIKKTGLAVLSCFGCVGVASAQQAAEPQGPVLVQTNVGPSAEVGTLTTTNSLTLRSDADYRSADTVEADMAEQFRLPLRFGNDFSPTNFAMPRDAARFKALDLSTPMPLRQMRGDTWSAEVTFGASSERTGLGFDVQASPRAQIQRNTAGGNTARVGGEIRLGQGLDLSDRDQRGSNIQAPAWYFFIGADNEALVWNFGDKSAMNGLTLRDQVTTGDIQAGVAWRSAFGGQMSLGVIERELEFNDIAGDRDVKRKDHFVAFSYTLRR